MGSPRVYCGPFVLIGAMNPCPCGYYGDPVQECTCSNAMVTRYQKRISGPLLDRACAAHRLTSTSRCPGSNTRSCRTSGWASRRPVQQEQARSGRGPGGARPATRARQAARFAGTRMLANADAPWKTGVRPGEVRDLCRLDDAAKSLPSSPSEPAAMQQRPGGTRMSARAYHRILKLARAMARKAGLDLAGSDEIQTAHPSPLLRTGLAEAIQYRPRRQT
jgi:magnesium chelatase family protein